MTMITHLTDAQIEAGMPEVLQSPVDHGVLEAIVIRPATGVRIELQESRLSAERGTEGDRWADHCWSSLPDGSPNPEVQICIMNSRMIQLLAGDRSRWALAGDNLFVDLNLNRESLRTGQQLAIGDCIIEITEQSHNGCAKFSERFGPAALRFVNSPTGKQLRLRGIYAKVVQAGLVRVGERIRRV
jgi:MOSC domain-containing protein YiiM